MRPKATKPPRRRIGRPPAGARAGERVKDYPQLSIRLPDDVKAKLQAISLIASRPQWRIITEAIECYLRERSDAERRMVDELVGRSRVRNARSRRVSES
jgi:predicted DNA-binding protein